MVEGGGGRRESFPLFPQKRPILIVTPYLKQLVVRSIFVTKTQTKMATGWTQFQPWQNQPLPPGWEARYDANVRR